MRISMLALGAGILAAAAGCVPNESYFAMQERAVAAEDKCETLNKQLIEAEAKQMRMTAALADAKEQIRKELVALTPPPSASKTDLTVGMIDQNGSAVLGEQSFDVGKFALTEKAKKFLDGIADQLSKNKASRVEVAGHTDTKPVVSKELLDKGVQDNRDLGYERAKAVGVYLESKGVKTKFVFSSWGEIKNQRKVEIKAFHG